MPISATLVKDSLVGQILSQYQIEARLGQGGMGVVYRARDLKLERCVAIKMLSPQLLNDERAKARFVREARAASALDHPNIGTVHELLEEAGNTFIVMSYYEGETLKSRLARGPIPVSEARGILKQMAAGLSAAHSAGIVHRDIKPANVMLARGGQLKLLDFGLAKLIASEGPALTAEGEALGTVLYASPEQLRGAEVTHRSDLWSLGVIAHEMLSGASPFRAESLAATAMRILEKDPPSLLSVPGVPAELSALVSRLLQKLPAQRPSSADEVLSALDSQAIAPESPQVPNLEKTRPFSKISALQIGVRRFSKITALQIGLLILVAAAAVGARLLYTRTPKPIDNLIAVLPFRNTGSADDDYLSDGLTEEIQTALGKVNGLRVAPRDSSFTFKDRTGDTRSVRQQLGASFVLTGTVYRWKDRVQVHARLAPSIQDPFLWSESYDRPSADIFAIQEEISGEIVKALSAYFKLGPAPTASKPNPEAYDLYLKGLSFYNRANNREDLDRSRDFYEMALRSDPKYALAWVGKAEVFRLLADAYEPPRKAYPNAKQAVTKALELDDSLPEAHIALAGIKLQYEWDPKGAREEFARAESRSKNNPLFHENRAWLSLSFDDPMTAIAEMKKAKELDPLSARVSFLLTWLYYLARDYDAAIKQDRETIKLNPTFSYQGSAVAGAYREKGMFAKALEALRRGKPPEDETPSWDLAITYAKKGEVEKAREMVRELENEWKAKQLGEEKIAAVYAALGDSDQAFKWLEKAFEAHCSNLLSLNLWPEWDQIRADPRFARLVERVGLPTSGNFK